MDLLKIIIVGINALIAIEIIILVVVIVFLANSK